MQGPCLLSDAILASNFVCEVILRLVQSLVVQRFCNALGGCFWLVLSQRVGRRVGLRKMVIGARHVLSFTAGLRASGRRHAYPVSY